jgi:hypothetical protein
MKKLMKKKVNMFGKTVPVLAIFILSLALVSAALVSYLSNTAQGEQEVLSPMVVGISAGREGWATAQCWKPGYWSWPVPEGLWVPGAMADCFPEGVDESNVSVTDWDAGDWAETSITFPVMYTGQENTFTFYLMSENVADEKTFGHEEIRVANPLGITCLDFVSSCTFDGNIYDDGGYGRQYYDCNSVPECHSVPGSSGTQIELWEADDESSWDAESTEVAKWGITFDNVIGTYTFTYRITPIE